jgi:hypothetical protein
LDEIQQINIDETQIIYPKIFSPEMIMPLIRRARRGVAPQFFYTTDRTDITVDSTTITTDRT